jgi:hypothetical protein
MIYIERENAFSKRENDGKKKPSMRTRAVSKMVIPSLLVGSHLAIAASA